MRRDPFKKKILIIILIVASLIGIMFLSSGERDNLSIIEVGLRDLLAPLNAVVMQVTQTFFNITSSITSHIDLVAENAQLKELVRDLTVQNSRLEEYRLENQRFEELLEFKGSYSNVWEMQAARVIAREPNNWFKNIIIDKGLKDGIKKDMAVINHYGLVGRVSAVSNNSAEVMLLVDNNSVLGAMVQHNRVLGVVEATPGGMYPLQMFHLSHDAPINVGDDIISSGLGGIFPKGLRIGYVAEVNLGPTGMVKFASIIPYVNFGRLEEVLVIINTKATEELREINEGADL